MKRIAFRVDGSAEAGMGHLSRCVTLAKELASRGASIAVALQTNVQQYSDAVESAGLVVHRMPARNAPSEKEDARDFLNCTQNGGPYDWLVVDHYGLGAAWESAARECARRILVISDSASRPHDCDLLLDQNLGAVADDYADCVPSAATVLVGPRYALLRPEFARLRPESPRRGAVKRVLVCFGGADSRDHTSAAVAALAPFASDLKVIVVLGPANANRTAVVSACRGLVDYELLVGPPSLGTLLATCDLAIGGGGTMTWERACLGIPTIAIGIAPNQAPVLSAVLSEGCALGVAEMPEPDVETLRAFVLAALRSPALLEGMARRGLALVDGNGARRIADVMLPRDLHFRAATTADSEMILAWRNHQSIRAASLDTSVIQAEAHGRWLETTLANPDRILLIAECAGDAIGIVRFDCNDDVAAISIYRAPNHDAPGVGLVRNAVEWLRTNRPDTARVVARVKAGNSASLRAFRSAGFSETEHELVRELPK